MVSEAVRASVDRDLTLHRVPGPSYQQLLDSDRYAVPEILRERSEWPAGEPHRIPRHRYFSQRVHDREVAGMWLKVWQMACRADQIGQVGDSILYQVAQRQYIVVRVDAHTVKAFPNTCLHRGRTLRTGDGRVGRLRCPYHGFAWNLDGSLADVPTRWDFDGLDPELLRMPEARVETWGGFVFVNPDPDAAPLAEHLGEVPKHFERVPIDDWGTKVHVAKVLDCNWKAGLEAFIEAAHVITTHPQSVTANDPCNSQYDIWENLVRIITPMGVPSVRLTRDPGEQKKMDGMMGRKSTQRSVIEVPDGVLARHMFADLHRRRMRKAVLTADYSDAEMTDLQTYWIFPNLLVLGGPRGTVMRFRPWGTDPRRCAMDVIQLGPPSPKDADTTPPTASWVPDGQTWSEQPGLADYELVDQDMANMIAVQRGIENAPDIPVLLSDYQESAIAHFHHLLYQRWLDGDGEDGS
ncbi:MAG TPA: aromatic ring-hydroxylating dioxygenase subunit alpha [Pseudonocardia sp.]|jgi:phenylpropionate dioxygenase-like ring-hydroxylating dioxygenase large terminal subunit